MNAKLKSNAAIALVAALLATVAPAMASTNDSAIVTNAMKEDLVPVSRLLPIVGHWNSAEVKFLDHATKIKVFDTRSLYKPADLGRIASAETRNAMQLGKFHAALRADAGLMKWFGANKLDVNRVIAVANPKGGTEIFLY